MSVVGTCALVMSVRNDVPYLVLAACGVVDDIELRLRMPSAP